MKQTTRFLALIVFLVLLSTLNSQLSTLLAQGIGTAFTYQGRLNSSGQPVNGQYDLRFRLSSDSLGNNYVGSPFLLSSQAVSNGLFTVPLDFGAGIFTGSNLWLQVDVRTNGIGSYTTLTPLQALTPEPYAIMAATASNLSGTLPTAQLTGPLLSGQLSGSYGGAVSFNNAASTFNGLFTGAFTGNGTALSNVNALTLGGLSNSNFWKTGGNAGTSPGVNFLGTTDNQALEFRVNGVRGLRLEPNANGLPNVIGGSPFNFVAPGTFGATIAGGGGSSGNSNQVSGNYGFIGGGNQNSSSGLNASVTSGALNIASGDESVVGGGQNNRSTYYFTTVAGGVNNLSSADSSTVGGGYQNQSIGLRAVVAGGGQNVSSGNYATVGGGNANTNSGNFATVSGGLQNSSSGPGAVVAGGGQNISSGTYGTVGGGSGNASGANYATVGGGYRNTNSGDYATVGGGQLNTSSGAAATMGGGQQNASRGDYATVGGGLNNTSSNDFATVSGGFGSKSSGYAATVGGGYLNIASGMGSFVGGGGNDGTMSPGNVANGNGSFIGSGIANTTAGYDSSVAGGRDNHATNNYASIPGGSFNTAGGQFSFAAGHQAKALHDGAFVWADSTSADFASTSSNQFLIRASGGVGIGTGSPGAQLEVASSGNTAIRISGPGGPGVAVACEFATYNPGANPPSARILATDDGSWSDDLDLMTKAPGDAGNALQSRLHISSGGNVGIGITNPTNRLHVAGGVSATAFVSTSDRNAKENFTPISPAEVLAKVAALPITQWNFKDMPGLRHMGPMAQDFYAAFGLGGSDTTITTVDPDGVALAAIQGLNAKVDSENETLRRELKRRDSENEDLKTRLAVLEKIVARLDPTEK